MLAHPLVFSSLYIMNKRHSVNHVIKFKMTSQKRVSDYFQQVSHRPSFEGVSNTIDLIDSSDGIDDEEDATEIIRDTVDS